MTKDYDTFVKFWIKDLPYIFIKNPKLEDCQRRYLVHGNTKIYHNKKYIDLYTVLNNKKQPNAYLLPPRHKKMCRNYFMVMNPYSDSIKLKINGEFITSSSYGDAWKAASTIFCKREWNVVDTIGRVKLYNILQRPPCKHYGIKFVFDLRKRVYSSVKIKNSNRLNGRYILSKGIANVKHPMYPKRDVKKVYEILPPNFPKKVYDNRYTFKYQNYHWGQLKLLLSEIDFLINFSGKSKVVVYAGAAPGNHIPFLARMFPDRIFILYDPELDAKFVIRPTPNIVIRKEYFTDEIARMYNGQHVMFITDIRTPKPKSSQKFEDLIRENMAMQKKWIKLMNPWNSLMKFRLPFDKGDTKYLKGYVFLQTFAKKDSTERRLVPTTYDEVKYNHTHSEEQMFYFNTEYRNRSFLDLDPFFGVNYDTYRSYIILRRYIESLKISGVDIRVAVLALMMNIEQVMKNKVFSDLLLK